MIGGNTIINNNFKGTTVTAVRFLLCQTALTVKFQPAEFSLIRFVAKLDLLLNFFQNRRLKVMFITFGVNRKNSRLFELLIEF